MPEYGTKDVAESTGSDANCGLVVSWRHPKRGANLCPDRIDDEGAGRRPAQAAHSHHRCADNIVSVLASVPKLAASLFRPFG
jgi:hypothetical protein